MGRGAAARAAPPRAGRYRVADIEQEQQQQQRHEPQPHPHAGGEEDDEQQHEMPHRDSGQGWIEGAAPAQQILNPANGSHKAFLNRPESDQLSRLPSASSTAAKKFDCRARKNWNGSPGAPTKGRRTQPIWAPTIA